MTATSTLANKTVVITGSATGIGAAVAALAREQGATVIGLDIQPGADTISVDLADQQSIDTAVAQLPAQIDVLCNVAGVPGTAPAPTVLAVNFLGGMRYLSESLRHRFTSDGSVVNVASAAGAGWQMIAAQLDELLATAGIAEGLAWYERAQPAMPVYNFSKAAAIRWSMRTSWAWRESGPRMLSVSPGPVETRILGDFRATMGPAVDVVRDLTGRNATAQEIAAVVCFAASPAASWMRGIDLAVDGGFSAATSSGAIDMSIFAGI